MKPHYRDHIGMQNGPGTELPRLPARVKAHRPDFE